MGKYSTLRDFTERIWLCWHRPEIQNLTALDPLNIRILNAPGPQSVSSLSLCPPDKLVPCRRPEVSWGRVSEETPSHPGQAQIQAPGPPSGRPEMAHA